MAVKELTDQEFQNISDKGILLVDFWAPWCGPCKMQGPILDEVATEIGEGAVISKMNVDEHTATPGKFGVRSIPTLILMKDGEVVEKFIGVQQKATLVDAIKKLS